MYRSLVLTSIDALPALSSARRCRRQRRNVEGIGVGFRHSVVLEHHHKFRGCLLDFDPHDIAAATFGGFDRTCEVLLTEVARPTNAGLWRLAHGVPPTKTVLWGTGSRRTTSACLNGVLGIAPHHAAAPPDRFTFFVLFGTGSRRSCTAASRA